MKMNYLLTNQVVKVKNSCEDILPEPFINNIIVNYIVM